MAKSQWDEKCWKCGGTGKVTKEDKHKQSQENCLGCNGSGILDPADVVRSLEGQYHASPLNIVGTYTVERLLKAGMELVRQRDELRLRK